MRRPGLNRPAVVWLSTRAGLTLAAPIAAFLQAGPAATLALAAALAFVRPLRRGWIAAIPIAAIAPVAPAAAALLAARVIFTEAFLQLAGAKGDEGHGRSGLRQRRRRGLAAIGTARMKFAKSVDLPVAASLREAEARLAAAQTGPGSLEDAAVGLAATVWAEARPWTLTRRIPELAVAVFAGVFDDEEGEAGGTSMALGRGLIVETFGPTLIAALALLLAVLVGALAFPAAPLPLGPVTLPGSLAQGFAVLALGLAAASKSCGGLVIATAIAVPLARSHVVEAAAIAAMVGLTVAAGNSALERFAIGGGSSPRRPREPFKGPRRLRGHWKAAVQAGEQGRLPIAIDLLESLIASPRCSDELRAQARARLALNLYESGRLDRAASVLEHTASESGLPPQALPAAGAVAAGLGDLDGAENLLRQALATLPQRSALRYRATLALADTRSRRGDPDEAIVIIEAQRSDPWGYGGIAQLLESEATIAAALVRQGDAKRARLRLDEILEFGTIDTLHAAGLSRDLRKELARAEGRARLVAGEIALSQSRFADAEAHLKGTLSRLEQAHEPHLHACARALHGVAHTFRQGNANGLREVDEGVRALEARRTQLHRGDRRTGLILAETNLYEWCFKAFELAARRDVPGASESAAWLIESLQKSALAQMLRGDGVELPEPARKLVEQIAELENRPEGALRSPSEAEAEISHMRAELSAISDAFSDAYIPTETSTEDLANIARRFGDVLSFYLPQGNLPGWRVWMRGDGTFEVGRVEVTDSAAVDLLALLSAGAASGDAALHAPIDSHAAEVWATLADALLPSELADSLLNTRGTELPQPLLVAADGVLGLVPWSGLLLDGAPLGTLAAIQIVPSLGVLEAGERGEPAALKRSALAHLDTSLEGHGSERQLLEENFELTLAAGRAEFLAALGGGDHGGAYLAVHGEGLGLGQSVKFEDGPLSAGSALQAPWPPWTIFASCLVGRMPMQAGQEPLGLPISCVLAGSQSVLAAMVEVPSATLPDLIEPLLAALAAGDHPAQGLARAQRLYIDANPHACIAECLGFVCLTRSPERLSTDEGTESRSWQETASAAYAAAETDPKRAAAIFSRGVGDNPEPALISRYAEFLGSEGNDPDEAGRVLEAALETHPENLELRRVHAWYLNRHGDDRKRSRAAFERVLQLDPDDDWAIPQFARFLRVNTEEYGLAADYYRRALEADPDESAYASALGDMLERTGDLAGAREMYERALAQEASRPWTSRLLADLLARTDKDVERIARLYERAIRLDPERAPSRFNDWAIAAVRGLEDRSLARGILERGHADHPEDSFLTINLAWLLFEAGERGTAISLAKQALEQADDRAIHLEAWFYLAALGETAGVAEARQRVEDLLREGVRSVDWDFSRIVARAAKEGNGNVGWLEETAQAIGNPVADAEVTPQ